VKAKGMPADHQIPHTIGVEQAQQVRHVAHRLSI
jgi:hypothetical protein